MLHKAIDAGITSTGCGHMEGSTFSTVRSGVYVGLVFEKQLNNSSFSGKGGAYQSG